jgi:thiol-disulfide isomerase/thioredoxin
MRSILGRRAVVLGLTAAVLSSGCALDSADGDSSTVSADGIRRIPAAERKEGPALTGETLTGEPLEPAAYRGKIVVLNMWASWCDPCRTEALDLQRVYTELKGSGVEFVGVNTRDSSRENAHAFEETFGIGYPSVWDPDGRQLLRLDRYINATALPNTIVLDRSGRIAAAVIGRVDEARLRAMLDPLLAEKG